MVAWCFLARRPCWPDQLVWTGLAAKRSYELPHSIKAFWWKTLVLKPAPSSLCGVRCGKSAGLDVGRPKPAVSVSASRRRCRGLATKVGRLKIFVSMWNAALFLKCLDVSWDLLQLWLLQLLFVWRTGQVQSASHSKYLSCKASKATD